MRYPHRNITILALLIAVGVAVLATSGARGQVDTSATPLAFELAKGMTRTVGCTGVETARTDSGKSIVVARFENMAAVHRWHDNELEYEATPLESLPDDIGPVVLLATVAERPSARSPIALELLTPITRHGVQATQRRRWKGWEDDD